MAPGSIVTADIFGGSGNVLVIAGKRVTLLAEVRLGSQIYSTQASQGAVFVLTFRWVTKQVGALREEPGSRLKRIDWP